MTDISVFRFRPPTHDQIYEHIWCWDLNNPGGVRLIPRDGSQGEKHMDLVVCEREFDTIEPGDSVNEYFYQNPWATHVWISDQVIGWSPRRFDLTATYHFTNASLICQQERQQIHRDVAIPSGESYPVIRTSDLDDYAQRDHLPDDYVWLIDPDHEVSVLPWYPNPFEPTQIHSFRMKSQLIDRYPQRLGGIRLVPRQWQHRDLRIHDISCPVQDKRYPLFTVDEITPQVIDQISQQVQGWFWVVDSQHDISGDLLYVPRPDEQQYTHVFRIPGQLEYRYPAGTPGGGAWLVNSSATDAPLKYQEINPLKYQVLRVNNVNDYSQVCEASTDMVWLVDQDLQIPDPDWVLPLNQRHLIHVFHVPGQLEHRYPPQHKSVHGAVKLVPRAWQTADARHWGELQSNNQVRFPRYETVEQGQQQSHSDWFWVVDPDVDVLPDFNFVYIPEPWHWGKTHLWQKLNPITGKQYDYGGVSLHCRESVPGRPHYVREPACVQHEYPVLYLDHQTDVITQLQEFEKDHTGMYWAVDPYVQVLDDFEFDYYPSHWDQEYIHVFENTCGEHTGVRLIPGGFATNTPGNSTNYATNQMGTAKLIPQIASTTIDWDLIHLDDWNAQKFREKLSGCQTDYVWTVDPDVELICDLSAVPGTAHRVVVWQRQSPGGDLHSYGGVRLWRRDADHSDVNDSALELNRLSNMQYIRKPVCKFIPYDVVFLSHGEPNAQENYHRLSEFVPSVIWVRDVTGILAAHQAAASQVTTKMFWVVDADAWIRDGFDFNYVPDVYDHGTTHVWSSYNPVTGAQYGYGGVKLLNTQQVLAVQDWGLDFTTGLSRKFKHMTEVSCETRFNTSAYATWRSAFRECVKLELHTGQDSQERLQGWRNPLSGAAYNEWAKAGAEHAQQFVAEHRDHVDQLAKINDYRSMELYFQRRTGHAPNQI